MFDGFQEWRQRGGDAAGWTGPYVGGIAGWQPASWKPEKGMEGSIVHTWQRDGVSETTRSWDPTKNIHLLEIDGNYVAIGEDGIEVLQC